MRRSILAVAVVVVSMFASQCLAADDQKPADQSRAGRPAIAPDAQLKAATNATVANQLVKMNDTNTGETGAAMTESGGNVFLAQVNARLVFWPDLSGSFISGTNAGLTLYGMGGTIALSNANTVINGYGTTSASGALHVMNQNSASLLYVQNDGNIGIGTNAPKGKLHVYGTATSDAFGGMGPDPQAGPSFNFGYAGASFGRSAGFLNVRPDASAVAPNPSLRFLTQNLERMIITRDGGVGIGTSNPGSPLSVNQESLLHILTAADKNEFLLVQNTSNTPNAVAVVRTWADVASVNIASHASSRTVSRWGVTLGGWNEILSWAGNGLSIGTISTNPLILGTNSAARLTIDGNGNITAGSTSAPVTTTFHGTVSADQVIGAVYQDVAEWVPATTRMTPGTVVVLNREHKNEVMPSARAYDTAVAGVVSAQPGILLGVASESKAQIATTGRVKVHVDATAGAIGIGDLLVTSDKPGTAMKSQPVDLGGVPIHRPGTVIGKALEPLPDGQGDILVLLSLQ